MSIRPRGAFEALGWSSQVVQHMLNLALFGGRMPAALLTRFLSPLHRGIPAPLIPRPRLFRRADAAIRCVLQDPPSGSIAAQLGRPS